MRIRHFPIIEPEVVRVELGDPYSRNCTPPVSNPTARVYWILKGDEGTAVTFESINSSHISSNEQASHGFSHRQMSFPFFVSFSRFIKSIL
ncbi:hypothetical protein NECAME_16905 [Necator americanus]|uniref:CD80-like immunoglobulin C2-set domain-containing protein n=1 Tax=Necator americanus TaxID=51031 RepID=W2TU00_NECAM|nr:hypothetical protein NECAME_16905 [Necator americanus]ETN85124.1 hypothetical protein NECAME_16905 [Necator americanus]